MLLERVQLCQISLWLVMPLHPWDNCSRMMAAARAKSVSMPEIPRSRRSARLLTQSDSARFPFRMFRSQHHWIGLPTESKVLDAVLIDATGCFAHA